MVVVFVQSCRPEGLKDGAFLSEFIKMLLEMVEFVKLGRNTSGKKESWKVIATGCVQLLCLVNRLLIDQLLVVADKTEIPKMCLFLLLSSFFPFLWVCDSLKDKLVLK